MYVSNLVWFNNPMIKYTDYRCPMKPFLLKSRTFGLEQTNWQINSAGAFGVFSAGLSFWYSESLVLVFHYSTIISTENSKIFIWEI